MKKIAPLATLFISGTLLIAGCNNAASTKAPVDKDSTTITPAFDLTSSKMDIDDANRNLMLLYGKSDSVGMANYYTTDAEMMESNAPVISGRKDIQKEISHMISSGATNLDLKTVNVWGDETLLAEEGTYMLATKDNKQVDKGKYIVLWKKEDGKLKILRDCLNSDLPAHSAK